MDTRDARLDNGVRTTGYSNSSASTETPESTVACGIHATPSPPTHLHQPDKAAVSRRLRRRQLRVSPVEPEHAVAQRVVHRLGLVLQGSLHQPLPETGSTRHGDMTYQMQAGGSSMRDDDKSMFAASIHRISMQFIGLLDDEGKDYRLYLSQ